MLITIISLLSIQVQAEQRGHTKLPETTGPWAVRAYYEDDAMLKNIRDRFDVWGIDRKDRLMLVGIDDVLEYQELLGAGFTAKIDEHLMQQYIDRDPIVRAGMRTIPGFACYRTVEETFAAQNTLIQNNPTLASLIDIGDTWEKDDNVNNGYDMRVLKITNSAIAGPKPVLYAMGSIHSREYAPAEVTTRFGEYLLNNYGTDADATWLVDYHEIHLLMQGNPDGRKVSEGEASPSQRKNRNANHCAAGNRGVDMNRNFEFMWNQGTGSSGQQCSDAYRGTGAVSEPENEAINNYINTIFADQRGPNLSDAAPDTTTGVYLDLHSFSNLTLWPYGFSDSVGPAPNHAQLRTLGRRMSFFTGYRPEQSNASLGGADGASDDNAYGRLGVAAYTIEIGSFGEGFYIPCANFENNHMPNNLQAMIYAAKSARTPYITPSGPDSINLSVDNNMVTAGTTITLTGVATDNRFNNSNGTESTDDITSVNAYLNTPSWENGATAIPLTAADGNFNTVTENFTGTIDTTGLAQGQHIVYVESTDADGVTGVTSALFFEVISAGALGTLSGTVTDMDTSQPIQGATVDFGGQTTMSAANGSYSFDIAAGSYELNVSADGYASASLMGISITAQMTTTQDVQLEPICALLDEDVDGFADINAATGWTHVADIGSDDWRVEAGDDHTTGSTRAFVSTDVASTSDKYLSTPEFTIGAGATFSFWHKHEFEETGNDQYDGGVLEITTDDGANWQDLEAAITANGYTNDLNDGFGNPLGGRNAWTGTQSSFIQVTVDLAAYAGNDVRIRWRMGTDSSEGAGDWLIDDIQLLDPVSCQGPTDVIFKDGFDTP
ncbi:M14 family zinc carboxypeptidase [Marinicella sp. W31]|uniref:M14 family zinc carboxypeptidase n=1 Tax=Marinicella sp. W31 TaxID=3023713 RepID=UPI0037573DF6